MKNRRPPPVFLPRKLLVTLSNESQTGKFLFNHSLLHFPAWNRSCQINPPVERAESGGKKQCRFKNWLPWAL
jgi:hypothetical protein